MEIIPIPTLPRKSCPHSHHVVPHPNHIPGTFCTVIPVPTPHMFYFVLDELS